MDTAAAIVDEDILIRKTLKLVRLFAGFSEQDARDFLAWAKRFDARPSEPIIREGEDEELATLAPGDSFGEIALLDSGPRSASVIAVTASTLLRFERRNLVKIPAVSLNLYRNIATMIASRLRDTSVRVILAKAAAAAPEPLEQEQRSPARPRRRIVRTTSV